MTLRRTTALTGAALAAALIVATCLPGDPGRPVGERCDGEQCEGELLCLYGRCRAACMTNRDCPEGALCVVGPDGGRACTFAEEAAECPGGCGEGATCVGRECVEIAPEVGADGDADADGDDEVDPTTELIASLAGNWVGVFGMGADSDGCLCLTLDEEGNVVPDASVLVLHVDSAVNYEFSGGSVSNVDFSGPDPTVEITIMLYGDEHTFSGAYDAGADELSGSYVAPGGEDAPYAVDLDRQGLSCADRIGAPEAGC